MQSRRRECNYNVFDLEYKYLCIVCKILVCKIFSWQPQKCAKNNKYICRGFSFPLPPSVRILSHICILVELMLNLIYKFYAWL